MIETYKIMNDRRVLNLIRVASAVPKVKVAEPSANAEVIRKIIKEAYEADVDIIVFPELCITGYTCGDLFHNSQLMKKTRRALFDILIYTKSFKHLVVIVGAPDENLMNCAYVFKNGEILGKVGKRHLPNYKEFYEKRWFKEDLSEPKVFNIEFYEGRSVKFGIEICEDLWSPLPPSTTLVKNGAEIIFNLSASNELVGKQEYLESLVSQQSARLICGYVYTSCGYGESTQDVVYMGKTMIAENGKFLNKEYIENGFRFADIDLDILRHDRISNTSFRSFFEPDKDNYIFVPWVGKDKYNNSAIERKYPVNNFNNPNNLQKIFDIQVAALKKRLEHTGLSPVIGISGGSDSTWALIICHAAVKELGKKIIGVTMPGFATSERTLGNSIELMKQFNIDVKVIGINDICKAELEALGHDLNVQDITYENVQARTRTQILMNLANQEGGLVIGTGDLSELALGWCTYNADHMSMYGINVGVPKTLIKTLIRWYANNNPEYKDILYDILDTPVSPELTGTGADGKDAQITEDKIGPYVIHDFFIYYFLRYGFSKEKLLWAALHSDLINQYSEDEIKKWLEVFIKRFFTQQFKRSCLPDGPKIGSISLSPRGDLRMPSDASYLDWI